jgi:hypothetical protein
MSAALLLGCTLAAQSASAATMIDASGGLEADLSALAKSGCADSPPVIDGMPLCDPLHEVAAAEAPGSVVLAQIRPWAAPSTATLRIVRLPRPASTFDIPSQTTRTLSRQLTEKISKKVSADYEAPVLVLQESRTNDLQVLSATFDLKAKPGTTVESVHKIEQFVVTRDASYMFVWDSAAAGQRPLDKLAATVLSSVRAAHPTRPRNIGDILAPLLPAAVFLFFLGLVGLGTAVVTIRHSRRSAESRRVAAANEARGPQ